MGGFIKTIKLVLLAAGMTATMQSAAGVITQVSVSSDGAMAHDISGQSSISEDGRFVVFSSRANNLVPVDMNDSYDVFVHDLQTGTTTRVSVASDGTEGDESSEDDPSISADGRFVAFESLASNLVPGDTNGIPGRPFSGGDVFLHDRQIGTTTRVSVASDGAEGNSRSQGSMISADARFVAFDSMATNLITGDTNNSEDIFVHDRQTGITERVSVASDGTEGNNFSTRPSISADGRIVVFNSSASNLVLDDMNNSKDIFAHDRQTGVTTRISVANDGTEGNNSSSNPATSADGRFIVFDSMANNLVSSDTNNLEDIFLYDQQASAIIRVSVGVGGTEANGFSMEPTISAGGRYIGYFSDASNLVPDDTNNAWDSFIFDRQTGITTRISVASDGSTEGNNHSFSATASTDGRFVVFDSLASNLVSGDSFFTSDVFVNDLGSATGPSVNLTSGSGSGGCVMARQAGAADISLITMLALLSLLFVRPISSL